jgi:hypothetical protein
MRSSHEKTTDRHPDDSRAAAHMPTNAFTVQRAASTAPPLEDDKAQLMPIQRAAGKPEDLEKVQPMREPGARVLQAKAEPNQTGMPDNLKSGIESLSGHDLSDVRVHYNSSAPKQLQALAYAQGSDIHIGPGQEKHLPHEAWHVVQQRQGRVQATTQLMAGTPVNDDPVLESEATEMGNKAMTVAAP